MVLPEAAKACWLEAQGLLAADTGPQSLRCRRAASRDRLRRDQEVLRNSLLLHACLSLPSRVPSYVSLLGSRVNRKTNNH